MKHRPIPPATVLALLPLVKPHKDWTAKHRIVSYVGSFEAGALVTSKVAGHHLRLSDARCRAVLALLDEERVLLRDGGGGDRKFWCELNPNVLAWRVPWRVSREELRDRLARHAELVRQGGLGRFFDLPNCKRYGSVSARLLPARSDDVKTPTSRPHGAIDNDGSADADRAPQGARSRNGLRVVQGGAMFEADLLEGGSPTPGGGADRASTRASGEEEIDPRHLAAAKSLIFRRTMPGPGGGRWVRGRADTQLRDLLARHGIDAFIEAGASVPIGDDGAPIDKVPVWLDHVSIILDAPADELSTPEVDRRRAELEQRITALRNQHASWSGLVDQDVLDDIGRQIAECENEVQQLAEGAA